MPTVTREKIRLELRRATGRHNSDSTPEVEFRTYSGTLSWDVGRNTLDLISPETGEIIVRLSKDATGLPANTVLLKDVPHPALIRGVIPEAAGALASLRTLGVIKHNPRVVYEGQRSAVELVEDLGAAAQAASTRTAVVTLFKSSGKYSFKSAWQVPVNATEPVDMLLSPDFQQVKGGAVLVEAEAGEEYPEAENWGYPQLFTAERAGQA